MKPSSALVFNGDLTLCSLSASYYQIMLPQIGRSTNQTDLLVCCKSIGPNRLIPMAFSYLSPLSLHYVVISQQRSEKQNGTTAICLEQGSVFSFFLSKQAPYSAGDVIVITYGVVSFSLQLSSVTCCSDILPCTFQEFRTS